MAAILFRPQYVKYAWTNILKWQGLTDDNWHCIIHQGSHLGFKSMNTSRSKWIVIIGKTLLSYLNKV